MSGHFGLEQLATLRWNEWLICVEYAENDVYAFLADAEERRTLLARQRNFRTFQETFFKKRELEWTQDELGYVSSFDVEGLLIAILGLNSAWLAEGGSEDERQLLIGEYQVTSAINIAMRSDPHIIIGMQHHSFDHLMRFDQSTTQRRLEEACHFLHFGHLHNPEASNAAVHSRNCLSLAAGASYESRTFRNTYSLISFDPLNAETQVTFVQYDPQEGTFSYESTRRYPHKIDAAAPCGVAELADAIETLCSETTEISHYLASLLLGDVSDVPVRIGNKISFGTLELLKRQNDAVLEDVTTRFLTVGRAVTLLCRKESLNQILADHGGPIISYVDKLRAIYENDARLLRQLIMRNSDALTLAASAAAEPFQHTLNLLDDLHAAGDWETLREHAERCSRLDNERASNEGKRMVALCLAQSSEQTDLQQAIRHYRELTASSRAKPGDWAALATLLKDCGEHDQAKIAVLQGIRAFPKNSQGFAEIGMQVVAVTGDIQFRDQLREIQRGE